VDGGSFRLLDPDGGRVPAVVEYRAASRTAILHPDAPLPPGRYTARLGSAITDRAGNALEPVTWRFNVRASNDVSVHLPSGRRARLVAGAHVGYAVNQDGTIADRHRDVLRDVQLVEVSRRATLSGLPGGWLLVSSGRWSGYWMRESPRAGLRGSTAEQTLPDGARLVIRTGKHTGYRFDGARIVRTRTATMERTVRVDAGACAIVNGRQYVRATEGAFAGYWLPESGRAHRPGGRDILDLRTTPAATIPAGRWTAYRYAADGSVLQTRTMRRATASSARAVGWAVINGRAHVAIVSGPWAGFWLPEDGVRLS
jgi:hypothetical protein